MIRIATDKVLITKVDYSITSMLSEVGGLTLSIMGVLSYVAMYLSRRIFMLSLLDKLFLVKKSSSVKYFKDDSDDDDDPGKPRNKRGSKRFKEDGPITIDKEEEPYFANLQ